MEDKRGCWDRGLECQRRGRQFIQRWKSKGLVNTCWVDCPEATGQCPQISKPWWVSLTTSSIFFGDITGIVLFREQALYLNSLGNSEGGEKKDLSSHLFLKNIQTKLVLIPLDLPPKCRSVFIRK